MNASYQKSMRTYYVPKWTQACEMTTNPKIRPV